MRRKQLAAAGAAGGRECGDRAGDDAAHGVGDEGELGERQHQLRDVPVYLLRQIRAERLVVYTLAQVT